MSQALQFKYGNMATSFGLQGRECDVMYLHMGRLRGNDNQGYTMVSRPMGSPWAGTLRIDGIDTSGGRASVLRVRGRNRTRVPVGRSS